MSIFSGWWRARALREQARRELPAAVEEVRVLVSALQKQLSRAPLPRRWGQLMILWTLEPPAARVESPGFYSIAFELVGEHQIVSSDTIQVPIPAGAWVVAVGCRMTQVMVGVQLQDMGSGIAGIPLSVLRLSDQLVPGYVLRAGVTPDPAW